MLRGDAFLVRRIGYGLQLQLLRCYTATVQRKHIEVLLLSWIHYVALLSITRQLAYIHSCLIRSASPLQIVELLLKRSGLISYDLHLLSTPASISSVFLNTAKSTALIVRISILRQHRTILSPAMAYRDQLQRQDQHIHHGWHHDAPCGSIIRNDLNKKYCTVTNASISTSTFSAFRSIDTPTRHA